MKSIFTSSKSRGYRYQSEIIETEISDWQSSHSLPHHRSILETKSHRNRYPNFNPINYVPRVCRINPKPEDQINTAIDILKYQLSDRDSRQKHLENVRFSLQHRLQVARATGNNQLIDILQAESQQLETSI